MRKLAIFAVAASAVAAAAPAAAQYYPAPPVPAYGYGQPYGYAQPYGHGYGYRVNYGQVRALQARIDNLQRHLRMLDRRDIIRNREANRLRRDARDLERRFHRDVRDGRGLTVNELRQIEYRLARLEQRTAYVANQRRWGYGYRRW